MFVAPWVRTITFGTPVLDAPLTPFLGAAPNVYYAVVPWLAYPLVGAVFGLPMIARSGGSSRPLPTGALPVGAGLLLAGGLLILVPSGPASTSSPTGGCRSRSPSRSSGIILLWLAVCDLATRRSWIDGRLGVLYGWSDRVIAIYFAHWIIVGWGVGLVGFRALPLEAVLLAMAAAVVATSYLSRFAVRLESSWWQRTGRTREESEVAVVVRAA